MVKMPLYHGMSGSRRGDSHISTGTVCQDHTACYVSDRFAIAAVSDGHGGSKHFRSDVGSKAASETAVRIVREFVESEDFETSFRSNQDVLLDNVCRTVLASWYSRIEDYDRTYPLTDAEESFVAEKGVQEDPEDVHHHTRYGATLMAAVIGDWFSFCFQIGDGEIACIEEEGNDRSPLPEDPNCRLNVTSSLCQTEPMGSFRHWCSVDRSPMAFVMSTDGVTNTFDSKASYVRYCRTASCFALDGGNQWERLMDSVKARSDASGRDDVSIAVICRECPAIRRMKDDVDSKYRQLDLQKTAVAKRRGKVFVSGGMEFMSSGEGAVMVSYKGDEDTVLLPERLQVDKAIFVVVGIADRCFEKSGMEHVVVPATIRQIGKKAFFKCDSLEDVTFKGTPELDWNSFFCCNRLSVVYHVGEAPACLGKRIKLVRRARRRARTGILS